MYQNVLVLHTGPDWWVKITDFGISKRSEGTALRTQIGTPSYQAPEVGGIYSGDSDSDTSDKDDAEQGPYKPLEDPYTSAVDIWSIGAIAFRLLEGKVAFSNPRSLCKYVTRGKKFPIPKACAWGDLPCADFIKQTMAGSASLRPSARDALQHSWMDRREPHQDKSRYYLLARINIITAALTDD
jgi:serine/threonine protein kinase